MTQETRFVGLDIGKFEIYAFDASGNAEISVANTVSVPRVLTSENMVCAVALANKMARIVWAIMMHGTKFEVQKA